MDENEVAARLLDEHGPAVEAAGAPRWLQVRVDSAGHLRAAVRPEPEGWLGHDLPAGWEAAAVVATGRVRSIDEGHELPAAIARARAGGLRLCCVVTRTGRIGWKAQLPARTGSDPVRPGAANGAPAHPLAAAPEEGMMLDVLFRAVGLSTLPPDTPAGALIILLWVEALLSAVEARTEGQGRPRWRARWSDLIGLHPALPLEPDTDPDEAESILSSVGEWATWEDFRRRAMALDTGDLLPRAEMAAWMDEGIFSRWVMEPLPRVDDALRLARAHLSSDAYHRLRRVGRLAQVPGNAFSVVPPPP